MEDVEQTSQIPTLVLEQLNGEKKGTQVDMEKVPDFKSNPDIQAANEKNRLENQQAKDQLSKAINEVKQTTESAVKTYQTGALTNNKL